jgi:3-oxoacyl-[acyl-carrier protein] reductase
MTRSGEGAVALVTGAASGIGRATALALAAAGYRVALNDRVAGEALDRAAAEAGGRAYPADVGDMAAVEAMVGAVGADLGPIAVAVCSAGIYEERALASLDDGLWERTLRVNLGGCYHVARAVAPAMRAAGGGAIVTVASEMALVGGSAAAHYVASKAAVLGLTRALARELAPAVRVSSVAPGPVDTPLLPERFHEAPYGQTLPLRRIGRPEEVADVIVALVRSTWTTGAVWSVNGGAVIA